MIIKWEIPNFDDELGEYFENEHTIDTFSKYGIKFNTNEQLIEFLRNGKLVNMTRDELSTNYDNLTLDDVDFIDELENPDYAESFYKMNDELRRNKEMRLPAPIIIKFGDKYYGFAGNRRMNLAFANNIPLKVWLVKKKAN